MEQHEQALAEPYTATSTPNSLSVPPEVARCTYDQISWDELASTAQPISSLGNLDVTNSFEKGLPNGQIRAGLASASLPQGGSGLLSELTEFENNVCAMDLLNHGQVSSGENEVLCAYQANVIDA